MKAAEYGRWCVMVALVGSGCGGTSPVAPPPPPPPPAVVTTIEVSPATATLVEGDSVRLTATVKDQRGAVMTGPTVTWNSSSPATASVAASGMVTAVAPGTATITASADGKSNSASVTVSVGPKLIREPARAVSATVGPQGGTITATGGSGLVYDLVVPPFALDSSVRITVTPLGGFRRLPFAGGLVGGVEFQPSGLTFGAGVKLRVKTAAPALGPNQILIGFTFDGDGDAVVPQPVAARNGGLELAVSHFSGGAVAIGNVSDLTTLPLAPNLSVTQRFRAQLTGLVMPRDQAAIVGIMHAWRQAIEPTIAAAVSEVEAKIVVDLFFGWTSALATLGQLTPLNAAFSADFAALQTASRSALSRGIDDANAKCLANRSLKDANNALFLHIYASAFTGDDLTGPGSGLTEADVLAGLCIEAVATQVSFPDPATPNSSLPLDLRFGVRFGTDPNLASTGFAVRLTAAGSSADGTRTFNTDAQGRAPTQTIGTLSTPLTLTVNGCVGALAGAVASVLSDVCVQTTVFRPIGARVINGDITVSSQVGLQSMSDVAEVTGNLTVTNVTSTDLRELALLRRVGKVLSITSSPSITSFSGLSRLQSAGGLALAALPNVTSLAPLSPVPFGSLVISSMPGLVSLFELQDLPATVTGDVAIINNAQLKDLFPLRSVTRITGNVSLVNNPALGNLSQLNALQQVGGFVNLQFLPGPGTINVSGLAGLTSIGTDLQISGSSLASFNALQALQTVGRDVTIFERFLPRLAQLSFPALTTINGRLTLQSAATCDPNVLTTRAFGFPALTRVRDFTQVLGNGAGVENCPYALDLSALATLGDGSPTFAGDLQFFGELLTSLKLGPLSLGARDLSVSAPRGASQLTALSFANMTGLRQMAITRQANLKSLALTNVAVSQSFGVADSPVLTSLSLTNLQTPSLGLSNLPGVTSVPASGSGLLRATFGQLALSQGQILALVKALGMPSGRSYSIDGVVFTVP